MATVEITTTGPLGATGGAGAGAGPLVATGGAGAGAGPLGATGGAGAGAGPLVATTATRVTVSSHHRRKSHRLDRQPSGRNSYIG